MIHQDLAAKILNVLLTASENKTFLGDEADKEEVLKNANQENEEKKWTISVPCYTYTATVTEMPAIPAANRNDAPLLDFESFKDELPAYQQTATGSQALTYLENYLKSNYYKDDTYVQNSTVQNIEKTMKFSGISTDYDKNAGGAPIYPIGFDKNILDELYSEISAQTWEGDSVEAIKNHLESFLITGLETVFGKLKNEVLKDSKYYNTSSALPILKEVPVGAGQVEYQLQNKKLSKIKYKIYTTKTVTGQVKLEAPSAIGGSRSSSYMQVSKKVLTIEEKDLSQTAAETFIKELLLQYYGQAATATAMAYYPDRAYIGLFTNLHNTLDENTEDGMPLQDGTAFREPPYKNYEDEDNPHSYQRMNLHRGLFSDSNVFYPVFETQEDDKHNENKGCAQLKNQEIIMFPEVLDPEGWGDISGFGIFENPVQKEGETPFFWGEVEAVEAEEGTVPLFRPEEFRIYLG